MGKDVIDFNKDYNTTTNTGQTIAIIDPNAFGDIDEFKTQTDKLIRDIRNSAKMGDTKRIWLPGEQSHEKRIEHLKNGIALPQTLVEQLVQLANQLHIQPLTPNQTK
jgi:LDH2 family malate/lactate/ureidoglycolate dehydrogenase